MGRFVSLRDAAFVDREHGIPGPRLRHDGPVHVTLLYVEDCPSWRVADRRLAEALRAVGLGTVVVEHRLVRSDEEARRTGFSGSPTILLDGADPFHGGHDDAAVGLSCRLYRTPSGLAGSPTLDQLVEVLAAAAAST